MKNKSWLLVLVAVLAPLMMGFALNGVFANVTASGFINSVNGYQFNGTAPSNHILLGNATNYIDAATLPSAALPTVGTAGTCTFPASLTTDVNGRVTSCTNGSLPKVIASLTFSSCTLAPDGGSVWDCNSSASWGSTLPNNTYQLVCTIDQGGYVLNNLNTVSFYKGAKTTTGFSYGMAADHSGANGFVASVDCLAVE